MASNAKSSMLVRMSVERSVVRVRSMVGSDEQHHDGRIRKGCFPCDE